MSNWNGKVMCVVAETDVWKVGKIYRVENGYVEREIRGMSRFAYRDIDGLNKDMASKFEEVSIPQPHKSLLKSGMKVVYRDGSERYVFSPTNSLYTFAGEKVNELSKYTDNLLNKVKLSEELDIMEIYSEDGELIAKREEKSAKDIKIEELEKRMRELADELAELK